MSRFPVKPKRKMKPIEAKVFTDLKAEFDKHPKLKALKDKIHLGLETPEEAEEYAELKKQYHTITNNSEVIYRWCPLNIYQPHINILFY